MKAASWSEIYDDVKPDGDPYSVVIVQWDEWKAFDHGDYITVPYKYKELEDIPLPPKKPDVSYRILTENDESWDVHEIRDDPPEWVSEDQ